MALRLIGIGMLMWGFSQVVMADVAVDPNALKDPVKETEARAIMKNIRCLVCQNQSIEDSDAVIAKTIRDRVRAEVAAGRTKADINASLVADYGDWVMLSPPVDARTYFLWGSPFLLLGAAALLLMGRRGRGPQPAAARPLTAAELKALDDVMGGDT